MSLRQPRVTARSIRRHASPQLIRKIRDKPLAVQGDFRRSGVLIERGVLHGRSLMGRPYYFLPYPLETPEALKKNQP